MIAEYVFFIYILSEQIQIKRKKKEENERNDYINYQFSDICNEQYDLLPNEIDSRDLEAGIKYIIRIGKDVTPEKMIEQINKKFLHNGTIQKVIEHYKQNPNRSNTVLEDKDAFILLQRQLFKGLFSYKTIIPALNKIDDPFCKDVIDYYIKFPNFLSDINFNKRYLNFFKQLFLAIPLNEDPKMNNFKNIIDDEKAKPFEEFFAHFIKMFITNKAIAEYKNEKDKKEILEKFKEFIQLTKRKFIKTRETIWRSRPNNKTEYPKLFKAAPIVSL